jgi:hypothetical protein
VAVKERKGNPGLKTIHDSYNMFLFAGMDGIIKVVQDIHVVSRTWKIFRG